MEGKIQQLEYFYQVVLSYSMLVIVMAVTKAVQLFRMSGD